MSFFMREWIVKYFYEIFPDIIQDIDIGSNQDSPKLLTKILDDKLKYSNLDKSLINLMLLILYY